MSFVEGNLELGIQLAPGTLERLQSQLKNLEKGATVKVNLDSAPINQGAKALDNLNKSADRASSNISQKLHGAIKGAGLALGSLAAVGGAGLVALGTKAIFAGKEFNILQQQVRAGLTAILGTSRAAEDLLKNVNKLNDTSPFPRSAFLAATQQLVGFGVQADKVVPIIDAVQNAVAGIGGGQEDIARFTRAFAQIQSQGRLTGDVLFTLGEKGIDAAAIIGQQMGKTGQDIKAQVTAGTLGADKAIDALTKGLSTKFDGAVANVARSFVGASDRVTARLRDIGALITGVFINPMGGGAAVVGLNNIANALANIRDKVIKPLIPMVQKLGDFFITATQKFAQFTSNIKTDQVQQFLKIFQSLLPIISVVGARLVQSLTSGLPIIGKLTGALGGPITAIALVIATVPQLREAFMQLVVALTPLVQAVLPALKDVMGVIQGTFVALTPVLGVLVGVIKSFTAVLTPLVNALQGMGVLAPILTILIAKFALTKIAGTEAFLAMSIKLTAFKADMIAAGVTTGTIGERLTSLKGAGTSALKSLASAIDPVQIALVAVTFVILDVINKFEKAKQKGREAADAITKGLNFAIPADQKTGVEAITAEMTRLKKQIDNGIDWGNVLDDGGSIMEQRAKISGLKTEYKALTDSLNEISTAQEKQRSLGVGVIQAMEGSPLADQFDTVAEAVKFATDNGVDFNNLRFDQILDTTNDVVKKIKELPTPLDEAGKRMEALKLQSEGLEKIRQAFDALTQSTKALAALQRVTAQELNDKVTTAQISYANALIHQRGAADDLLKVQRSLTEAQKNSADLVERLAKLEKDRADLLADTRAETRELEESEASLARSRQELLDLSEREQDLLHERDMLAREGPEQIAAGDRSIERARIALNNATREEIELQKELNHENDITVDLAGASVDEIKSRMAGARAQLAAQRAVLKSKKTEQQKTDELKTAELNRLDAAAALNDTIQARGDMEYDQGIAKRENEEAINTLHLDREAALRRQEELIISHGKLLAGETTTAATLKQLDKDIAGAHWDIETAAIAVRDRSREVETAINNQRTYSIDVRDRQREIDTSTFNIKQHSEDIRDAQKKIAEDSVTYRDAVATAKGDQAEINRLLGVRIGLNSQLLASDPALLDSTVKNILGPLATVKIQGPTLPGQDLGSAPNTALISKLIDILLHNPAGLADFLKNLPKAAEGAIVRQHSLYQVGEGGRAEVVLPLTKPGRAMTLLADSIPLMHTALQRKIAPLVAPRPSMPSAISPSTVAAVARTMVGGPGSGGGPVVRKADGPATYGQIAELIDLLKRLNDKEYLHVEAPTTIETGPNEDVIVRRVSRQLERKINELLRGR